jgi:hypothetical protein
MASVPFCKSHKSSLDTFSEKFDQAVGKNILSSEKVNIFCNPSLILNSLVESKRAFTD